MKDLLLTLALHLADPALEHHPDALAGEAPLQDLRRVPVLASQQLVRLLEDHDAGAEPPEALHLRGV